MDFMFGLLTGIFALVVTLALFVVHVLNVKLDLPAPKVNGHVYPNGSIVSRRNDGANLSRESTPGPDFTDISEARLRNMIQKIIAETVNMPPLLKTHAISEIALYRPSKMSENLDLTNGRRHRTEHYFEPTIYQDLLATAVLNKIVDKQSCNNNRNMSESSPDLSHGEGEGEAERGSTILDQNYNMENQSITSGSSVEPRSDCSYTDTEPIVTTNDDKSSEFVLDAGRDSALSDYIAAHMVPLPDLSTVVTESEEDDYMSVTSSVVGDSNWENNWLFKKKKPTLSDSVAGSSVGMLVPDPKEDVRAQIGDKTADEISDLSELGSDTDDSSLDVLRSKLDPINDRLFNKHLIGGQNSKMALDELIERSSMISNTLPTDQELPYTETRNENVEAPNKTEAINCSVAQQNDNNNQESQKNLEAIIPPAGFGDAGSNPLTANDEFESEVCTGFGQVEVLEPTVHTSSVVEILAAIALGPMLAVQAVEEPAALSTDELLTLNELKDLALAEIKARTLEMTSHSLGVIPEEMGEIDLQNFPTPDEIEEELNLKATVTDVYDSKINRIESAVKVTNQSAVTSSTEQSSILATSTRQELQNDSLPAKSDQNNAAGETESVETETETETETEQALSAVPSEKIDTTVSPELEQKLPIVPLEGKLIEGTDQSTFATLMGLSPNPAASSELDIGDQKEFTDKVENAATTENSSVLCEPEQKSLAAPSVALAMESKMVGAETILVIQTKAELETMTSFIGPAAANSNTCGSKQELPVSRAEIAATKSVVSDSEDAPISDSLPVEDENAETVAVVTETTITSESSIPCHITQKPTAVAAEVTGNVANMSEKKESLLSEQGIEPPTLREVNVENSPVCAAVETSEPKAATTLAESNVVAASDQPNLLKCNRCSETSKTKVAEATDAYLKIKYKEEKVREPMPETGVHVNKSSNASEPIIPAKPPQETIKDSETLENSEQTEADVTSQMTEQGNSRVATAPSTESTQETTKASQISEISKQIGADSKVEMPLEPKQESTVDENKSLITIKASASNEPTQEAKPLEALRTSNQSEAGTFSKILEQADKLKMETVLELHEDAIVENDNISLTTAENSSKPESTQKTVRTPETSVSSDSKVEKITASLLYTPEPIKNAMSRVGSPEQLPTSLEAKIFSTDSAVSPEELHSATKANQTVSLSPIDKKEEATDTVTIPAPPIEDEANKLSVFPSSFSESQELSKEVEALIATSDAVVNNGITWEAPVDFILAPPDNFAQITESTSLCSTCIQAAETDVSEPSKEDVSTANSEVTAQLINQSIQLSVCESNANHADQEVFAEGIMQLTPINSDNSPQSSKVDKILGETASGEIDEQLTSSLDDATLNSKADEIPLGVTSMVILKETDPDDVAIVSTSEVISPPLDESEMNILPEVMDLDAEKVLKCTEGETINDGSNEMPSEPVQLMVNEEVNSDNSATQSKGESLVQVTKISKTNTENAAEVIDATVPESILSSELDVIETPFPLKPADESASLLLSEMNTATPIDSLTYGIEISATTVINSAEIVMTLASKPIPTSNVDIVEKKSEDIFLKPTLMQSSEDMQLKTVEEGLIQEEPEIDLKLLAKSGGESETNTVENAVYTAKSSIPVAVDTNSAEIKAEIFTEVILPRFSSKSFVNDMEIERKQLKITEEKLSQQKSEVNLKSLPGLSLQLTKSREESDTNAAAIITEETILPPPEQSFVDIPNKLAIEPIISQQTEAKIEIPDECAARINDYSLTTEVKSAEDVAEVRIVKIPTPSKEFSDDVTDITLSPLVQPCSSVSVKPTDETSIQQEAKDGLVEPIMESLVQVAETTTTSETNIVDAMAELFIDPIPPSPVEFLPPDSSENRPLPEADVFSEPIPTPSAELSAIVIGVVLSPPGEMSLDNIEPIPLPPLESCDNASFELLPQTPTELSRISISEVTTESIPPPIVEAFAEPVPQDNIKQSSTTKANKKVQETVFSGVMEVPNPVRTEEFVIPESEIEKVPSKELDNESLLPHTLESAQIISDDSGIEFIPPYPLELTGNSFEVAEPTPLSINKTSEKNEADTVDVKPIGFIEMKQLTETSKKLEVSEALSASSPDFGTLTDEYEPSLLPEGSLSSVTDVLLPQKESESVEEMAPEEVIQDVALEKPEKIQSIESFPKIDIEEIPASSENISESQIFQLQASNTLEVIAQCKIPAEVTKESEECKLCTESEDLVVTHSTQSFSDPEICSLDVEESVNIEQTPKERMSSTGIPSTENSAKVQEIITSPVFITDTMVGIPATSVENANETLIAEVTTSVVEPDYPAKSLIKAIESESERKIHGTETNTSGFKISLDAPQQAAEFSEVMKNAGEVERFSIPVSEDNHKGPVTPLEQSGMCPISSDIQTTEPLEVTLVNTDPKISSAMDIKSESVKEIKTVTKLNEAEIKDIEDVKHDANLEEAASVAIKSDIIAIVSETTKRIESISRDATIEIMDLEVPTSTEAPAIIQSITTILSSGIIDSSTEIASVLTPTHVMSEDSTTAELPPITEHFEESLAAEYITETAKDTSLHDFKVETLVQVSDATIVLPTADSNAETMPFCAIETAGKEDLMASISNARNEKLTDAKADPTTSESADRKMAEDHKTSNIIAALDHTAEEVALESTDKTSIIFLDVTEKTIASEQIALTPLVVVEPRECNKSADPLPSPDAVESGASSYETPATLTSDSMLPEAIPPIESVEISTAPENLMSEASNAIENAPTEISIVTEMESHGLIIPPPPQFSFDESSDVTYEIHPESETPAKSDVVSEISEISLYKTVGLKTSASAEFMINSVKSPTDIEIKLETLASVETVTDSMMSTTIAVPNLNNSGTNSSETEIPASDLIYHVQDITTTSVNTESQLTSNSVVKIPDQMRAANVEIIEEADTPLGTEIQPEPEAESKDLSVEATEESETTLKALEVRSVVGTEIEDLSGEPNAVTEATSPLEELATNVLEIRTESIAETPTTTAQVVEELDTPLASDDQPEAATEIKNFSGELSTVIETTSTLEELATVVAETPTEQATDTSTTTVKVIEESELSSKALEVQAEVVTEIGDLSGELNTVANATSSSESIAKTTTILEESATAVVEIPIEQVTDMSTATVKAIEESESSSKTLEVQSEVVTEKEDLFGELNAVAEVTSLLEELATNVLEIPTESIAEMLTTTAQVVEELNTPLDLDGQPEAGTEINDFSGELNTVAEPTSTLEESATAVVEIPTASTTEMTTATMEIIEETETSSKDLEVQPEVVTKIEDLSGELNAVAEATSLEELATSVLEIQAESIAEMPTTTVQVVEEPDTASALEGQLKAVTEIKDLFSEINTIADASFSLEESADTVVEIPTGSTTEMSTTITEICNNRNIHVTEIEDLSGELNAVAEATSPLEELATSVIEIPTESIAEMPITTVQIVEEPGTAFALEGQPETATEIKDMSVADATSSLEESAKTVMEISPESTTEASTTIGEIIEEPGASSIVTAEEVRPEVRAEIQNLTGELNEAAEAITSTKTIATTHIKIPTESVTEIIDTNMEVIEESNTSLIITTLEVHKEAEIEKINAIAEATCLEQIATTSIEIKTESTAEIPTTTAHVVEVLDTPLASDGQPEAATEIKDFSGELNTVAETTPTLEELATAAVEIPTEQARDMSTGTVKVIEEFKSSSKALEVQSEVVTEIEDLSGELNTVAKATSFSEELATTAVKIPRESIGEMPVTTVETIEEPETTSKALEVQPEVVTKIEDLSGELNAVAEATSLEELATSVLEIPTESIFEMLTTTVQVVVEPDTALVIKGQPEAAIEIKDLSGEVNTVAVATLSLEESETTVLEIPTKSTTKMTATTVEATEKSEISSKALDVQPEVVTEIENLSGELNAVAEATSSLEKLAISVLEITIESIAEIPTATAQVVKELETPSASDDQPEGATEIKDFPGELNTTAETMSTLEELATAIVEIPTEQDICSTTVKITEEPGTGLALEDQPEAATEINDLSAEINTVADSTFSIEESATTVVEIPTDSITEMPTTVGVIKELETFSKGLGVQPEVVTEIENLSGELNTVAEATSSLEKLATSVLEITTESIVEIPTATAQVIKELKTILASDGQPEAATEIKDLSGELNAVAETTSPLKVLATGVVDITNSIAEISTTIVQVVKEPHTALALEGQPEASTKIRDLSGEINTIADAAFSLEESAGTVVEIPAETTAETSTTITEICDNRPMHVTKIEDLSGELNAVTEVTSALEELATSVIEIPRELIGEMPTTTVQVVEEPGTALALEGQPEAATKMKDLSGEINTIVDSTFSLEESATSVVETPTESITEMPTTVGIIEEFETFSKALDIQPEVVTEIEDLSGELNAVTETTSPLEVLATGVVANTTDSIAEISTKTVQVVEEHDTALALEGQPEAATEIKDFSGEISTITDAKSSVEGSATAVAEILTESTTEMSTTTVQDIPEPDASSLVTVVKDQLEFETEIKDFTGELNAVAEAKALAMNAVEISTESGAITLEIKSSRLIEETEAEIKVQSLIDPIAVDEPLASQSKITTTTVDISNESIKISNEPPISPVPIAEMSSVVNGTSSILSGGAAKETIVTEVAFNVAKEESSTPETSKVPNDTISDCTQSDAVKPTTDETPFDINLSNASKKSVRIVAVSTPSESEIPSPDVISPLVVGEVNVKTNKLNFDSTKQSSCSHEPDARMSCKISNTNKIDNMEQPAIDSTQNAEGDPPTNLVSTVEKEVTPPAEIITELDGGMDGTANQSREIQIAITSEISTLEVLAPSECTAQFDSAAITKIGASEFLPKHENAENGSDITLVTICEDSRITEIIQIPKENDSKLNTTESMDFPSELNTIYILEETKLPPKYITTAPTTLVENTTDVVMTSPLQVILTEDVTPSLQVALEPQTTKTDSGIKQEESSNFEDAKGESEASALIQLIVDNNSTVAIECELELRNITNEATFEDSTPKAEFSNQQTTVAAVLESMAIESVKDTELQCPESHEICQPETPTTIAQESVTGEISNSQLQLDPGVGLHHTYTDQSSHLTRTYFVATAEAAEIKTTDLKTSENTISATTDANIITKSSSMIEGRITSQPTVEHDMQGSEAKVETVENALITEAVAIATLLKLEIPSVGVTETKSPTEFIPPPTQFSFDQDEELTDVLEDITDSAEQPKQVATSVCRIVNENAADSPSKSLSLLVAYSAEKFKEEQVVEQEDATIVNETPDIAEPVMEIIAESKILAETFSIDTNQAACTATEIYLQTTADVPLFSMTESNDLSSVPSVKNSTESERESLPQASAEIEELSIQILEVISNKIVQLAETAAVTSPAEKVVAFQNITENVNPSTESVSEIFSGLNSESIAKNVIQNTESMATTPPAESLAEVLAQCTENIDDPPSETIAHISSETSIATRDALLESTPPTDISAKIPSEICAMFDTLIINASEVIVQSVSSTDILTHPADIPVQPTAEMSSSENIYQHTQPSTGNLPGLVEISVQHTTSHLDKSAEQNMDIFTVTSAAAPELLLNTTSETIIQPEESPSAENKTQILQLSLDNLPDAIVISMEPTADNTDAFPELSKDNFSETTNTNQPAQPASENSPAENVDQPSELQVQEPSMENIEQIAESPIDVLSQPIEILAEYTTDIANPPSEPVTENSSGTTADIVASTENSSGTTAAEIPAAASEDSVGSMSENIILAAEPPAKVSSAVSGEKNTETITEALLEPAVQPAESTSKKLAVENESQPTGLSAQNPSEENVRQIPESAANSTLRVESLAEHTNQSAEPTTENSSEPSALVPNSLLKCVTENIDQSSDNTSAAGSGNLTEAMPENIVQLAESSAETPTNASEAQTSGSATETVLEHIIILVEPEMTSETLTAPTSENAGNLAKPIPESIVQHTESSTEMPPTVTEEQAAKRKSEIPPEPVKVLIVSKISLETLTASISISNENTPENTLQSAESSTEIFPVGNAGQPDESREQTPSTDNVNETAESFTEIPLQLAKVLAEHAIDITNPSSRPITDNSSGSLALAADSLLKCTTDNTAETAESLEAVLGNSDEHKSEILVRPAITTPSSTTPNEPTEICMQPPDVLKEPVEYTKINLRTSDLAAMISVEATTENTAEPSAGILLISQPVKSSTEINLSCPASVVSVENIVKLVQPCTEIRLTENVKQSVQDNDAMISSDPLLNAVPITEQIETISLETSAATIHISAEVTLDTTTEPSTEILLMETVIPDNEWSVRAISEYAEVSIDPASDPPTVPSNKNEETAVEATVTAAVSQSEYISVPSQSSVRISPREKVNDSENSSNENLLKAASVEPNAEIPNETANVSTEATLENNVATTKLPSAVTSDQCAGSSSEIPPQPAQVTITSSVATLNPPAKFITQILEVEPEAVNDPTVSNMTVECLKLVKDAPSEHEVELLQINPTTEMIASAVSIKPTVIELITSPEITVTTTVSEHPHGVEEHCPSTKTSTEPAPEQPLKRSENTIKSPPETTNTTYETSESVSNQPQPNADIDVLVNDHTTSTASSEKDAQVVEIITVTVGNDFEDAAKEKSSTESKSQPASRQTKHIIQVSELMTSAGEVSTSVITSKVQISEPEEPKLEPSIPEVSPAAVLDEVQFDPATDSVPHFISVEIATPTEQDINSCTEPTTDSPSIITSVAAIDKTIHRTISLAEELAAATPILLAQSPTQSPTGPSIEQESQVPTPSATEVRLEITKLELPNEEQKPEISQSVQDSLQPKILYDIESSTNETEKSTEIVNKLESKLDEISTDATPREAAQSFTSQEIEPIKTSIENSINLVTTFLPEPDCRKGIVAQGPQSEIQITDDAQKDYFPQPTVSADEDTSPMLSHQSTIVEVEIPDASENVGAKSASDVTFESTVQSLGNQSNLRKLKRQYGVEYTTPSFEDIGQESSTSSPPTSSGNTTTSLATLCQHYIYDKHLVAALESRRRQTLLMHRFLSTIDSFHAGDDDSMEDTDIHTEVLQEPIQNRPVVPSATASESCCSTCSTSSPSPVDYEQSFHDHPSSDCDDCSSDSHSFNVNEHYTISYNFINTILFSDQISVNSTSLNDDFSLMTTVEEMIVYDDIDDEEDSYDDDLMKDIIIVDKFNKINSSRTAATNTTTTCTSINTTTNNIPATFKDKFRISNNTSGNTSATSTIRRTNPKTSKNNNEALLTYASALESPKQSATYASNNVANGHVANNDICDEDVSQNDEEDDLLANLRRFVPGSIAEREYKKWYNAVEMPNNPYAPEALKRRISGSQERFIDLPNISPSTEQSPLDMIAKDQLDIDQNGKRESDYSRYSRDYYINNGSKSTQTSSLDQDISKDDIETEQKPGALLKPLLPSSNPASPETQTETVSDLYQALPAHVVEDMSSSLDTMSQQSMQSANTTTSDDSDTIKIYNFKKQETTIVKDAKENQPIEKKVNEGDPSVQPEASKERPTALGFSRTESGGVAAVITPTRGSTPTAFKFLQPKRKLLDPSQVLSLDEEEPPVATGSSEKPVIEKEVVKALPSVKALAKAFLLTSSSVQHMKPERAKPIKAKTLPEGAKIPQNTTVSVEVPPTAEDKSEEDVTITSDLSSLETDPSSVCKQQTENTKDPTSPSSIANAQAASPTEAGVIPTNSLPVRQGVLKSNIAFFENLKNMK